MTERRRRLADAIREVAAAHALDLERLITKGREDARRPGFLWHALLVSYASWGSVRGHAGLIEDRASYEALAWATLREMPPDARVTYAEPILRRAKVRYPRSKAELLARAVDVVGEMGGPEAATQARFACEGMAAKLAFLKRLPGVGAKYARNVLMDVHDPDLRASIAVDARIRRLAKEAGLEAEDAGELEVALLEVAALAGLDGWTVDRVIFGWSDEVRAALGPQATPRTVRVTELAEALVGAATRSEIEAALGRFEGRVIA